MTASLFGYLSLGIWAYLLFARGGFWLARERDDRDTPQPPAVWPSVAAVVPARDEVAFIAASVGSLLAQDYPGPFRVILVDDESSDGTAQAARAAAEQLGAGERLEILGSGALPGGWTGKLWAMSRGVAHATAGGERPDYLLFTDADIAHQPENLSRLVARAEAGRLTLTSLMVELHCKTFAERLLIPAFVFFFQMLYPFGWVNRAGGSTAAAAGGCMLARREALEAAGGVAAIRTAIIDDCALARVMRRQGPIWLGLTHRAHSLRPAPSVAAIGRMVSRSAYAQLDYSKLLLLGTLVGLAATYIAPPAIAVLGSGGGRVAAALAWAGMALAFQPILRFYRRSPLWGVTLPVIAVAYAGFTLDSALQFARGRGGMWKGRAQAAAQAGAKTA
jgi:hopene-associated glycosyltransferase HpnB